MSHPIEAFQLCHQNRTHLYTKTCAAILENGFVRGSICGIETGLKDERLNSQSSGGVAQCNKYYKCSKYLFPSAKTTREAIIS